MQSRLEDVLKDKERELKLYEKFVGLTRFCEDEVFPFSPVPLQEHVEALKKIVEKLIPEPKDRREEMFSGEVFVLLCVLYLHDIGAAGSLTFWPNPGMLNAMEAPQRTLFLNNEIGRRLDIPEKAMELVNSLILSIKKIPIEWEIAEEAKKAIIRNAPVLGAIFDFAHLIWDVFSRDSCLAALKRQRSPDLRPGCGEAAVDVNSRDGIISISCSPAFPYQVHMLNRIREHVDTRFNRFKDAVNGRLGFQYRQIEWDIAEGSGLERIYDMPGHFPFSAFQGVPYVRWDEASRMLDTLFQYGYVVVVGDGATGKTTMLNSFVAPQLRRISPNVFYAELWDHPVHDIREAIGNVRGLTAGDPLDIISTCKKLLIDGPCFFIVDGCERLKTVGAEEGEKLERFIRFCLENEDVYLIALGDKEEFFAWYRPFKAMSMSSIFEISPLIRSQETLSSLPAEVVPLEILKEKVDEVARQVADPNDLRETLSVLTANGGNSLKRYSVGDICFETRIPPERVLRCLGLLQEKGIVRRQEVLKAVYWTLSSRHLKEHLYRHLGLEAFAHKRRVRETLRNAAGEGRLLGPDVLDTIEDLRDSMKFGKREMGLILASMAYHGREWREFLDKAEKEVQGFDSEFALSLLGHDDARVREATLRLLGRTRDDALINPLLAHLRKESSPELRMLLVESFVASGKRRSIVALMSALTEMADKDAKAHVGDRIYHLPARTARDLLIGIADVEKDPEMIDRIDYWLSRLEE